MMTLERYSHVMHLTSQVSGELADGQHADRRAAGHAARRHGVAARPRCGRWRSSTTLEPSKRGPYAGVVGYLDFSGNIDTAIAIRTHGGRRRRPGVACRPAPASWPTACPSTRTSSATTRPRPCWRPCPAPGA